MSSLATGSVTADTDTGAALSDASFQFLRKLILEQAGISLADHKRSMIFRRLWKRVAARGFRDFDAYCQFLAGPQGESEFEIVVNALTTNKTDFFREGHHFRHLAETALPAVMGPGTARASRLRIWSAGCSTGQEPYSIAMTLVRALPDLARLDARILATDIDSSVISKAEAGLYAEAEAEAIPAPLRSQFLQPAGTQPGLLLIKPQLQSLISFRRLNLHDPWPMKGPFEAIFCRNVVIYFEKQAQLRLFHRFADILAPGGFLYIGHSESLFRVAERFNCVGQSIYRKIA